MWAKYQWLTARFFFVRTVIKELVVDLCAVRYKVVTMGKVTALQMREKDEIREMLGRSPDKGDAVAMTFISGIPAPNSKRYDYEPPEPPDWRT